MLIEVDCAHFAHHLSSSLSIPVSIVLRTQMSLISPGVDDHLSSVRNRPCIKVGAFMVFYFQ